MTQTDAVEKDNKFSQTTTDLSSKSPTKVEMRKKILTLEKELATSKRLFDTKITLEDVFKFLEQNYCEKSSLFLKSQLSLLKTSPTGSRYSDDLKKFALGIYFLGPKAYKKMSTICRLPSKRTLHRFTQKWVVEPGFNEFIFQVTELKLKQLKEKEKDCIVCLDEISIKSHLYYDISKDKIVGFQESYSRNSNAKMASTALTVMVRGLASNWKLPLAYFFYNTCADSADLKDILFTTIRKCRAIGLNIMGVVSDQGPNFQKLVKSSLKLDENNPFFFVDDTKIVYLFDIPHLLKSTRNNFFSYIFSLKNGETKKHYLETFYNNDKTKQYKLAPKLTNDHIFPNNFQKMKVKLASQVFSHSVATGMHTYIHFNVLPQEASVTASFVEKMNDLFDLLNSNNFENCQAFMGTGKQFKLLEESFNMFNDLKILDYGRKDVTKRMKFILGWKITIRALIALWGMLKERGYKYLFTRNLNQDCLENFFGQIRNCSGNVKNPTPIQFCRAFKKLFSLKYFNEVEGANCMDDINEVLINLGGDYTKKYSEILGTCSELTYTPLKVFTNDYQNLKSPEGNALIYVTGYLLKKCLGQHSCDVCLKFAENSSETLANEETIFLKQKSYLSDKTHCGGLTVPSKDMVDHVVLLENIFLKHFNSIANKKGIGNFLKEKYSEIKFCHPCPNFPLNYYISLYSRLRIYFTLKFLNQEIKTKKCQASDNMKLNILKHL